MRQVDKIRAAFVLALLALLAPALAPAQTNEQGASTRRQADRTERANRDATVADETGTIHGTPPAQAAPPPYGPQLYPGRQQVQDPARKDPAEVHDETDTLTKQPVPPPQPARKPQAQMRRPAAQAAGPMAPRPLRPLEAAPSAGVPIPPPATAPQPPERGTTIVGSCPGGICSDAAGNSYNTGSNGTAISNSGRLCTRGTASVQCL
jgi:hypothetical protein